MLRLAENLSIVASIGTAASQQGGAPELPAAVENKLLAGLQPLAKYVHL
jgi:hypothetical protein